MKKISISAKYYLTGLLVIIVLPVIILVLYEWLAGGVLNGLAGSWRKAAVHPDIFLLFIDPIILLSGYVLLIYFFRRYKAESRSVLSSMLAYLVFIIATVITALGVFWKALTT